MITLLTRNILFENHEGLPSANTNTTGRLSVGGTSTGELETSGDRDWFEISLTSGASYQFDHVGNTLSDPYLYLRDQNGNLITSNDDGGSGYNSRITFNATRTGSYFIDAGSYQNSLTGSYTLSATQTSEPPTGAIASPLTTPLTGGDDYSDNTNTTGRLSVGGTSTGELETSGDRDWFEISLTSGASYQFDHVGNTLSDPYLYLRDQNGNLITSNDDGGSGYNSRITFNATRTGSYFIDAGSYQNSLTGSYTLSATQTSAPPTAPPTGGDDYSDNTNTTGRLSVGGTSTGELETSGDRDWFEISLTSGASYQFDHVGNTLSDPYLYLRDQNGNLITSNDDGGSGYNPRITFNATRTGSYFIDAGSYQNSLTGSYTLSATQTSAPPTAPPTTPPTAPINSGNASFSISGTPSLNQLLTIELDANDPDGNGVFNYSWQSSSDNNTWSTIATGQSLTVTQSLEGQQVQALISYTDAEGFSENIRTESVTILNTDNGDDYSDNTNTTGRLSVGGTSTGELETSGDRDWFEISLTSGASYQFDHVGNTLSDPYLYLRDQNGNLITSNDDGGSGYNPRITFNATRTGSYFIDAGSYQNSLTGSYTLSATQTSAPPTAPPTGGDDYSDNTNTTGRLSVGGTSTGELETSGDRDWFEISLTSGASYQFDHVGNTLSDPYLYLRDQNGNLITSNDDGGSGYNSRITFNATRTGSYFIDAGSYQNSLTGSYTLSATQTSAPPTAPINSGNASFSISGTPSLNQLLTIELDANDPDGNGVFNYSWQSSSDNNTWSTIATGQSLTVTQSLEGQQVQALISYTDAEGFSENIRTESVTILNTDNGDAAFSISGTPSLNQLLTIELDANDPDGNGVFNYSWQSSSDNNTWSTIATGQSLTVTQSLEGQQVQALISYTDAEGFSENIRTESVTILNTDNGDDYSDNTNTTGRLSVGGTSTGELETSGDRDWFEISLTSGASYQFDHVGNTLSDPYLYLRDQNGNLITSNDDGGSGYNSRITFNATRTGSYFIDAGSYQNSLTGSYTLSATELHSPEAGFNNTDGWGEVSASRAFEQLLEISLPSAEDLGGNYWGLDNINAPEVWAGSAGFSGVTGAGITVAVIDTGVDLDHDEFQGRITAGYDFVDNDSVADDGNGHGTHVAGTIAGDDDDGLGITGVAPDALIMPIRVLNNNGNGYTSDIIEGIGWAVNNGADVINLSLGGGGYSQAMADAIEDASNRGTVVVMAAGNSGGNSPDYPAAHAVNHGIAVGAVDQNRNIANFSNLAGNTTLDYVTAPGVNIYSSVPNGQYSTFSGTSMATPHVAGVVALLKSYDNSLSASAIEDLLTSTASNAASNSSSNQAISLPTRDTRFSSNIITLDNLNQFSEDQLATRLIGRIGDSNIQSNEEIIEKVNIASQGNTTNNIEALGSSEPDFFAFSLSETYSSINQSEILSDLLTGNQFEYFEVDSQMSAFHTTFKSVGVDLFNAEDELTGAVINTPLANNVIQSPTTGLTEENTGSSYQDCIESTTYQIEIDPFNLTSPNPSFSPVTADESQQLSGLLPPIGYFENHENNLFLAQ